ncbi:unnamed protein product [Microthlaspi erraticum]|uniref:Uncharacterized protein n=1 Tax=Microthlaspi erraticum TaxID=1685480 RepID=A0A6D2L553_9BRAS|nr:unnamed protein product [Microthlaspi erraticum]
MSVGQTVWDALVRFWLQPTSIDKSGKCSAARLTVGPDGKPISIPHTAGQTPFAGRRLDMAAKNGGVLPPLTALFQDTHTRKDGTFVTPRAEQIHNDLTARVLEEQTQLSQQLSPGGTQHPVELGTPTIDRIYEQVAPKNKGKVIGLGSIRQVPIASSFAPRYRGPEDDPVQLRAKISRLEETMEIENSENDVIFSIIATHHPDIAAVMSNKRRRREAATAGVTSSAAGAAEEEELTAEQQRTADIAAQAAREAGDLPPFE